MLSKFIRQWYGLIIMAACCLATVWLGAVNKLTLYIHPRYIWFTCIMAGLGLVGFAYASLQKNRTSDTPNWLTLALAGLLVVGLLAIPPKALTSDAFTVRSSSTPTGDTRQISAQASTADFSVKDWHNVLAQNDDPSFYALKPVSITGFVTPKDKDVFNASRFVLTCCAVDATPVSVPVYSPGWQDRFSADQWVSIKGTFKQQGGTLLLIPTSLEATSQPEKPYDY